MTEKARELKVTRTVTATRTLQADGTVKTVTTETVDGDPEAMREHTDALNKLHESIQRMQSLFDLDPGGRKP